MASQWLTISPGRSRLCSHRTALQIGSCSWLQPRTRNIDGGVVSAGERPPCLSLRGSIDLQCHYYFHQSFHFDLLQLEFPESMLGSCWCGISKRPVEIAPPTVGTDQHEVRLQRNTLRRNLLCTIPVKDAQFDFQGRIHLGSNLAAPAHHCFSSSETSKRRH